MKLTKSLFLAFAGLGLFACSNEDVADNGGAQFKGNGAVAVKIVSPDLLTRNAGGATTGDANTSVAITGDLTITLTGKTLDAEGKPTLPYEESIIINAEQLKSASEGENATILKFWNIAVPEKLTASINGGVADYSINKKLIDLQVAAANVPAYGETTSFTKSSDTEGQSPNLKEDNDTKKGTGTEQGAGEGDDSKVYEMYEASVTMAIPVARLEVGNITHVTHKGTDDDQCIFTALKADGAYLDGYTLKGAKYHGTSFLKSEGTAEDFSFDGVHGTGAKSGLIDEFEEAQSFMAGQKLAGPFTYNFYANGTNPVFKLYFGTAEGTNIIEPRYAMVTKYKDADGHEVTFQNGHIYRILSATLYDKNIIGDEGGNTLFGVEVTVEEATWTLHTIEADWAE